MFDFDPDATPVIEEPRCISCGRGTGEDHAKLRGAPIGVICGLCDHRPRTARSRTPPEGWPARFPLLGATNA